MSERPWGRRLAGALAVVVGVIVCCGVLGPPPLPPTTYTVSACGLSFTTNHWFDHTDENPGSLELRGPLGRVITGCVPADTELEAYHRSSRQVIAAMSKGTMGAMRAVQIDGYPALRSSFDIPAGLYGEGHVLTIHTGQQLVELRIQVNPGREAWWESLIESIDLP